MSQQTDPAAKAPLYVVLASLATDLAVVLVVGALAWHGTLDKTTVSTILGALVASRAVARAARERGNGQPPTGPTGGALALFFALSSLGAWIFRKKIGA
jgi:hypothetical protein